MTGHWRRKNASHLIASTRAGRLVVDIATALKLSCERTDGVGELSQLLGTAYFGTFRLTTLEMKRLKPQSLEGGAQLCRRDDDQQRGQEVAGGCGERVVDRLRDDLVHDR